MKLLYLFISTGDKTCFYTLRGMYEVQIVINREVRYVKKCYFHKNLSTDKAKAETLAQEAADQEGVPLYGNAEFDLNEIKRKKETETAAERERVERAIREAEEAEEREYHRAINEGVFVMGRYNGYTPAQVFELNQKYVYWLAWQHVEGSIGRFNTNAELAKKFLETAKKSEWVGEVGQDIQLTLTLKEAFWTQGRFPSIVFQCTDSVGNNFTFFSTAQAFKSLKAGDTFKVKASIKDHYQSRDGIKSTTLNKPKIQK